MATVQKSLYNVNEKIEALEQKVKAAKAIQEDIGMITNSGDFLADDEIIKTEASITKKRKFVEYLEEKCANAKRLKEEIKQKEKDPLYLSKEHINFNERKIENARKALKKVNSSKGSLEESFNQVLEVQQEALKELECVICLDIPKEDVFSCTEHHILCSGCKQQGLLRCPICRQDFVMLPPTRNRIAKIIIQKLN